MGGIRTETAAEWGDNGRRRQVAAAADFAITREEGDGMGSKGEKVAG